MGFQDRRISDTNEQFLSQILMKNFSVLKSAVRVLRPHQWVKNGFVFLPLFFHGDLFDGGKFGAALAAFFAFSFAASAIYCLNDMVDVEADRAHPEKCRRPFASGALPKTFGWVLMGLMLALSGAVEICFGGGYYVDVLIVIAVYVVLNAAYSLWLKRIAIVDVFVVSLGFVLRLQAGSLATQVKLSNWIVLMTFLLALFLAFAKRRDDVILHDRSEEQVRRSVARLNLAFLNAAIVIVATMTMVCYIMYTVSDDVMARFGTENLYVTSLFVLLGVLRYLQRTLVDNASGSPTRILLGDRFLQCVIAGWIVAFGIIIYL